MSSRAVNLSEELRRLTNIICCKEVIFLITCVLMEPSKRLQLKTSVSVSLSSPQLLREGGGGVLESKYLG